MLFKLLDMVTAVARHQLPQQQQFPGNSRFEQLFPDSNSCLLIATAVS